MCVILIYIYMCVYIYIYIYIYTYIYICKYVHHWDVEADDIVVKKYPHKIVIFDSNDTQYITLYNQIVLQVELDWIGSCFPRIWVWKWWIHHNQNHSCGKRWFNIKFLGVSYWGTHRIVDFWFSPGLQDLIPWTLSLGEDGSAATRGKVWVWVYEGVMNPKHSEAQVPIGSMYGIFNYIWDIYGINVAKYSIHGSSGVWVWVKGVISPSGWWSATWIFIFFQTSWECHVMPSASYFFRGVGSSPKQPIVDLYPRTTPGWGYAGCLLKHLVECINRIQSIFLWLSFE